MSEREHLRLTPINPFTPRQEAVINCVLEGASSREQIASMLCVSGDTVKKRIEGRKSKEVPGIYGIIESAYGVRPRGLYQAISIMQNDVIITQTEKPTFQIHNPINGERYIKMEDNGKTWILIENLPSGLARQKSYYLHLFGIAAKADIPINIKKSLDKNRPIPLRKQKRRVRRIVGFYVEEEKIGQLLENTQLKSYFKDGYFN